MQAPPLGEFESLSRLLEVAAQSGQWGVVALLCLLALAWAVRKRRGGRK